MSLARLLYVNDDLTLAQVQKESLEAHFSNLRFDVANSNEEAFKRLSRQRYDIAFYDLGMDDRLYFPNAQRMKDLYPGMTLVATSLSLQTHRQWGLPDCFDDSINTDYVAPDKPYFRTLMEKWGLELEKKKKKRKK